MIRLFITAIIAFLVGNLAFGQNVWINEIHYDDASTDANECIEIAGEAGIDLSCLSIVLYNGGTGASYDTDALTGTMSDLGCGFGVSHFCYPSNGIQNGNPDGIAIVNTCTNSVIQFLSYGGSFTATNGPANGLTSTNIGVTEGGSIANGSLQLIGSGDSYSDFTWQTENASILPNFGSLNSGQSISPCGPPSNTISAGTISGGPFSVDCNGTTDAGSITYTSTGEFNPGNTFTLQLSNSAGSFASPLTIGSDANTGTDPSGSINFTLPDNLPTGAGYQLQITSSDPVTTSSVSSAFTITQTGSCITVGPHITSVIINSCETGICDEGHNEIIFGNSGGESLLVNTTNLDIFYGTSSNPTANYTSSITTNATTTAVLNDSANCATTTFFEGSFETIPANATFMVVRNTICPDALDWASLCGAGPIYVIYSTSGSWSTSGNFTNDNDVNADRFFEIHSTNTTAESFEYEYEWNTSNTSEMDGDYATFPPTGGNATTYGNNGCTIDPVVLGSDLLSFNATYSTPNGHITWMTSSETSNDYFELFHSSNGLDWNKIASIKGAGTTTETNSYEVFHRDLEIGNNYYKLFSVDFDGSTHFKGIRMLKVASTDFAYFNALTSEIIFNNLHFISIYSLDGKLIANSKNSMTIPFHHKGVFILYDADKQQTQRLVIF